MCFICKNLQKSFKTIRSSYQDQYGIEKLIYLTNHTLYQTVKKFLRIYMYIMYIYIYIYISYIYYIYTRWRSGQKSFKTISSSYQDQYGIEKLIYLTTHTLYQTINCISNKQINMRIYMYIIYIYIYIYHIYIIYTRDGSRTYFRCCYTYLSFYLCFILSFKKKKLLHVLIFIKLLLEKIQEQSKII